MLKRKENIRNNNIKAHVRTIYIYCTIVISAYYCPRPTTRYFQPNIMWWFSLAEIAYKHFHTHLISSIISQSIQPLKDVEL